MKDEHDDQADAYKVKYVKPAGLFEFMLHLVGVFAVVVLTISLYPLIMNQMVLPGIFSILAVAFLLIVALMLIVLILRNLYLRYWIRF